MHSQPSVVSNLQGLLKKRWDAPTHAAHRSARRNVHNPGYTGQPIDRIARDVDRDYIMSAEQAVEYGMIDRVVSSRELTPHGHFAMMLVE